MGLHSSMNCVGQGFTATSSEPLSPLSSYFRFIGLPLLALAGLITAFDLALAASSLVPCMVGVTLGSRISGRMEPFHFALAVDLLLLATGLLTISRAI